MTPTHCYSSLMEQHERQGDVDPHSKHPRYKPHGCQSCSAELISRNLSRNQIIRYISSQCPSRSPMDTFTAPHDNKAHFNSPEKTEE